MAYNYEYPYTDPNRYNDDWLLARINELEETIRNLEGDILEEANAYTDAKITERLAGVEAEFNAFKEIVNQRTSELSNEFDEFVVTVNARMAIADANIRAISARVDSALATANSYTNQAIINNNEYIIDQTTKALGGVTVLNYFTGARVSIQEMFDYLAQFHLTNAISINQLVNRQKSVDD